jgi:hypothetical protein
MRALLGDHGFTISILVAVLIATIFAFVLAAPPQLVVVLLILGLLTGLAEHFLHLTGRPPE